MAQQGDQALLDALDGIDPMLAALDEIPGPSAMERAAAQPGLFGRGFGGALISGAEGVGQLLAKPWFTRSYGESELVTKAADAARATLEAVNPVPQSVLDEPEGLKRTLTTGIPSALGSTAGLAAEAVLGGPVVGLAGAALAQGGGAFNDAKAHGASDDQAFTSLLFNLPIGAIDAIPGTAVSKLGKLGASLARMNKASGGLLSETLKTGAFEGGTEGLQRLLENVVASDVAQYDEGRSAWEGVGQDALIGAIVGGLAGGATGIAQQPTGQSMLDALDDLEPSQEPQRTREELLGQEAPPPVERSLVQPGAAEAVQMALPEAQPQPGVYPSPALDPAALETAAAVPSYEEAQARIDALEDNLGASGVDTLKLYDPRDEYRTKLFGGSPGYSPMPQELVDAYRARDDIGAAQLREATGEIMDALSQTKLSDAEKQIVLEYYGIHGDDPLSQARAARDLPETVQSDPRSQAESLAIALAARRGRRFDETRDIPKQDVLDAMSAVQAVLGHFGRVKPKALPAAPPQIASTPAPIEPPLTSPTVPPPAAPPRVPPSTQGAPPPAPYDFAEETKADRIYTGLVDDLERGKQVTREAPNKPVDEEGKPIESAEEALSLFAGRRYGERLELDAKFTVPLRQKLAETGIPAIESTADAVSASDFLYAVHAPTANEVLMRPDVAFNEETGQGQMGRQPGHYVTEELPSGEKNRRFVPFDLESNPASGMSNTEAQEIVDKALKGRNAEFYRWLQDWNRKLNNVRMDARESGGLIHGLLSDEDGNMTPPLRMTWEETWGPDYVPLRTAPVEEQEKSPFASAAGFNTVGEETQRREGRSTKADSPLVFALTTAQQALDRKETNRIGNLLAASARANPGAQWRVETDANNIKQGEERLWFKEAGEQRWLVTSDKALGEMFHRLQNPDPGVLRVMDPALEYLHKVIIQWNPVFPLYNAPKDIVVAAIKHAIAGDARATVSVLVHSIPAMRGAWNVIKDENAQGYWEDRYRQLRKEGGLIGWAQQFNFQEQTKAFDEALTPEGKAKAFATLMDKANRSVELGPRLVTYDAMLRSGMSSPQAAIRARRITADFARRGRWAPIYRRFYLFSGANVQGTAEMIAEISKNPKRAAIVLGALTGAGLSMALLSYALGDEDELRKLSEMDKSRFFGVMIGKRRYGIPAPWGFSIFPYIGWKTADVLTGRTDMGDAVKGTVGATLSAFSPLPAAPNASLAVTPTLARPFFEIGQNTDFAGRPIAPPVSPYDLSPPPNFERSFRTVSPVSDALAEGVYRGTGELVDISPEWIDHLAKAATGGLGTFAGRSFEAMRKVVTGDGDKLRLSDIPVARPFVQEAALGAETRLYYETLSKIDRAKDRRKSKETLSESDRMYLRLEERARAVKSRIEEMRDAGVDSSRIDDVLANFNRAVAEKRRAR